MPKATDMDVRMFKHKASEMLEELSRWFKKDKNAKVAFVVYVPNCSKEHVVIGDASFDDIQEVIDDLRKESKKW